VSLSHVQKAEITINSDPVVEEITLNNGLFSGLKQKFVELGTPMEEMWRLVMPESLDMLHGFGGKPETMANLKELLQSQTTEAIGESDRSWACDVLDKALNPQQTKLHLSSTAHRNRLKLPEEGEDEPESSDDKPDDLHTHFGPLSLRPAVYHGSYNSVHGSRIIGPRPCVFQ
jgi:hypothetical protein